MSDRQWRAINFVRISREIRQRRNDDYSERILLREEDEEETTNTTVIKRREKWNLRRCSQMDTLESETAFLLLLLSLVFEVKKVFSSNKKLWLSNEDLFLLRHDSSPPAANYSLSFSFWFDVIERKSFLHLRRSSNGNKSALRTSRLKLFAHLFIKQRSQRRRYSEGLCGYLLNEWMNECSSTAKETKLNVCWKV